MTVQRIGDVVTIMVGLAVVVVLSARNVPCAKCVYY